MASDQLLADRPAVLFYHPPSFRTDFVPVDTLRSLYRLLDPNESPEPTHSFLSRHAHDVRVVVVAGVPILSDTLHLLPKLELIISTGAGLDKIGMTECRGRGIAVTNASLAFAVDGADYCVGLLLDVLRRISAGDRFIRAGSWPAEGDYPLGYKLGGKRVGIVGMGGIGSETAKRLAAFGCSIAYNSRKQRPTLPFPFYPNVVDLAENSDILVLCCGLTNETRHLIDKEVMTALGKEGVIVNVGRGAVIDEKELVKRLVRGEMGGAGLDVFEDEPNVPRELFELDNVVLSPHCAVATPDGFAALRELVLANLKAFFANQPLLSLREDEPNLTYF